MQTDEADESPLAGRLAESGSKEDVDAEDTPDWLSFAAFAKGLSKEKGGVASHAEPVIPKRGEKDFEPASEERYVNLQTSLLGASRSALFTAISSGSRYHSSRSHNRAIWDVQLQRAYMVHVEDPALPPASNGDPEKNAAAVHGIHFLTMGRHEPQRKRLELLPEEALYLIERGTIECWTGDEDTAVPMTVQHAWSAMIHAGGLDAERYHVYAWLRRLGYTVVRADFPRPNALAAPEDTRTALQRLPQNLISAIRPISLLASTLSRLIERLVHGTVSTALQRLRGVIQGKERSLIGSHRWFSYDQIFTSLQFVRSGKQALQTPSKRAANPYGVFFHVYKPVTKFKKSDPPEPDFRIGVINAETTPVPVLYDFQRIFGELPLEPIPPPAPPRQSTRKPDTATPSSTSLLFILRDRLYSTLGWSAPTGKGRPVSTTRPAPYARLKAGHKSAIIAVVDNGTISFQRFGETDFSELPWVGDGYSPPDV